MEPRISLGAVRDALPTLDGVVYLNTGGAGPLPLVVARAIERTLAGSLARGRASLSAYDAMTARHEGTRLRLAALLAAHPDEIALSTGSSAGMNTFVWSIDWKPGDEAVTTSLEHPGLMAPLYVAAQRHGVRLHVLPLTSGGEDLEARVRALTNARTRLVALSHVSYATGARLDVEGAARAARDAGALVLVDGAQGAGSVPTDPRAMGADGYALSGQKWLLGPEGLGALWVRCEAMPRLSPTSAGILSGTDHQPDGRFTPHAGARRLEVALVGEDLLPGWAAGLDWLAELGWEWIHRRGAEAAVAARRRLEEIPGVDVVTPGHRQAGLVAFRIAGVEPEAADARLVEHGVIGRWIPHHGLLRVCPGFFTNEADIARLGSAVALIASGA